MPSTPYAFIPHNIKLKSSEYSLGEETKAQRV